MKKPGEITSDQCNVMIISSLQHLGEGLARIRSGLHLQELSHPGLSCCREPGGAPRPVGGGPPSFIRAVKFVQTQGKAALIPLLVSFDWFDAR